MRIGNSINPTWSTPARPAAAPAPGRTGADSFQASPATPNTPSAPLHQKIPIIGGSNLGPLMGAGSVGLGMMGAGLGGAMMGGLVGAGIFGNFPAGGGIPPQPPSSPPQPVQQQAPQQQSAPPQSQPVQASPTPTFQPPINPTPGQAQGNFRLTWNISNSPEEKLVVKTTETAINKLPPQVAASAIAVALTALATGVSAPVGVMLAQVGRQLMKNVDAD